MLRYLSFILSLFLFFSCDSSDSAIEEGGTATQAAIEAGIQGGTSGISGTAGAQGGTAGAQGGTAGAQGGTAGAQGGTAGAQGGTAGAQGGTAGTQGGTAGAQGGTAGAQGGTAGAQGGTAGAMEQAVENPTYHRDIRPILDKHCNACHNGQSVAPYDFNSDHQLVSEMANVILFDIENGNMPPWFASDDCAPLKGSLKLKDTEIQTIRNWINLDKLMGDEADFIAPERINPDLNSERLTNAEELNLLPAEPYMVPQEQADDFRCFAIQSPFDQKRSVIGYEAQIDNEMIAHHMLILSMDGTDENRAKLQMLEGEDDLPGFNCFGVPSFDGLKLLGAWAPGGGKTGFPNNTALEIQPNSIFVVQMHYNTQLGRGVDQSGAKLWFAPQNTPSLPAELVFVGNLPFQIPAGVNGLDVPEEECDVVYGMSDDAFPRPSRGYPESEVRNNPSLVGRNGCVIQELYYQTNLPVKVHAAFPHMHTKGKYISIDLSSWVNQQGEMQIEDQSEKCLIKTTRWDFDWQRTYWLQEPIRNYTQGRVRLTCRFDTRGLNEAVNLGEGTGDEMCLGLLYVSLAGAN